ncbi:hypothetical protein OS493_019628 [Desmophyllum pertusum]|uniref:Uncharacterized protein n=1 Tax=Desmophyllum pertusum TaxID=174260 RepID=A0A9W9ZC18_9CNID|nr:hypothetical protein OS493_019628 [Desmophyllum pertusum]
MEKDENDQFNTSGDGSKLYTSLIRSTEMSDSAGELTPSGEHFIVSLLILFTLHCPKHLLAELQCTIFHNLVLHNLDGSGFSCLFSAELAQRKGFTSVLQISAVLLSIGGIVLMAYAEGFRGPNAVGVGILCVVAAIGAAVYKVAIKTNFILYFLLN